MIADSWSPPTTFTPMRQRVVAFGEDGKVGDCVRCCVAMLLGRPYEEVPHFVEEELQGKGNWFERLGRWMSREGYPVRLTSSYEMDPEAPAEPGDWNGFRWSAEPAASTRGIEGRRGEAARGAHAGGAGRLRPVAAGRRPGLQGDPVRVLRRGVAGTE